MRSLLVTDVLVLPSDKLLTQSILLLALLADLSRVLLVQSGDLSGVVQPKLGCLLLHVLIQLFEVVVFLDKRFLEGLVVIGSLCHVDSRILDVVLERTAGGLRLGEGLTVGLAVELEVVVDCELFIQPNQDVLVVFEVLEKLCLLVVVRAHLVAVLVTGVGAAKRCLGLGA